MPRPRLGAEPLSNAQRCARRRAKRAGREAELIAAIRRAIAARTIKEAREILASVDGEIEK